MPPNPCPSLAVIGGGPAGLMAAEVARDAGIDVDLYEAKGSVGRKFLIAGKGGLNLTHSESMPGFAKRYREREAEVAAWLAGFGPDAVRDWALGLGVETYVGSSGRVFPLDRRAAPLMRGWVHRLRERGVRFHVNHRLSGWATDGALVLSRSDAEPLHARPDAVVLALGGGSWPQLGSDGAWVPWLTAAGIDVAPLLPANCGFDIDFSEHFSQHHAGAAIKPVVAYWHDSTGRERSLQGECVATATGIEGSLVYAMSADLRDAITATGQATLTLDLVPDRPADALRDALGQSRRSRTHSEHLRRQVGISGVKAALLREVLGRDGLDDVVAVVQALKRLPLTLRRPRPLDEAISSAGGVRLQSLDAALMSLALPGVFCAGEMLDWEAPTGGYLLTACLASGRCAGRGAVDWLRGRRGPTEAGRSEP